MAKKSKTPSLDTSATDIPLADVPSEDAEKKPLTEEKPNTDKKPVARLAMKGRGNRFYAFRNMNRLQSLQRFKVLFGFMKAISILVLVVSILAFGIYFLLWILGVLLTLGLLMPRAGYITFGLYGFVVSVAIFVSAILLRILIERVYYAAERHELKKVPDGAQKYLDIMRVNIITDFISLGLWVAVGAVVAIGMSIDSKNKGVIAIVIVIAIIIYIIGRVLYARFYNKVADQIDQVKKERRQNRMTNTEY